VYFLSQLFTLLVAIQANSCPTIQCATQALVLANNIARPTHATAAGYTPDATCPQSNAIIINQACSLLAGAARAHPSISPPPMHLQQWHMLATASCEPRSSHRTQRPW